MARASGLEAFWAATHGQVEARAEPRRARKVLTVTAVERDSTGAAVSARGTIDGDGDFSVPVRGEGVRVGMRIGVTQPAGDPYAPLAFDGIDHTDDPTAGFADADPDLPAPAFAGAPFATAIVKSPGSVTARGTVYFVAVPDRYRPSGYTVSWRPTAGPGQWQDLFVPHLGGTQECSLGSGFAPGSQVDVKLRARYDWAAATSLPTATTTFALASDNATPGSATALVVDSSVPGQLLLSASGTVDAALFDHWQYELNDTSSGPADQVIADRGQYAYIGPAGAYYARVAPVSKSGTVGGYYPPLGWDGPHTLAPASVPADTTPPGAWAAPALTGSSTQLSDGAFHGYLRVDLPGGHSYEGDYDATEVSLVCDDGRAWVEEIPLGSTWGKWEVGFGAFTVALRGRDKQGNRPAFGPTASATIGKPAAPSAAPTVGTSSRGLGIQVSWGAVANAQRYEVQRATDNLGTGATTVATVDSLWWLDTLTSTTLVLPTYYYRVRAIGVADGAAYQGAYSGWVAGTVGAVDGQNLRAASVTANELAANSVIANKIAAGVIDATKLAATLTITQLLKTANSGARWELEGASGGGGALQLRLYDAGGYRSLLAPAGYTVYQGDGAYNRLTLLNDGLRIYADSSNVVRMLLAGNGLNFYNNSGTLQISTGIDGSGYGYLANTGGFTIRGPYAELDLSAGQYMLWKWYNTGADYMNLYLRRVYASGVNVGIGFLGQGPGALGNRFLFVNTADPFNATDNRGSDYTQINGGLVYASQRLQTEQFMLGAGYTANPMSGGGYGSGWDWGSYNLKAWDLYAVRGDQTGVLFLGDQSTGAHYLYFNGSNYVMPTNNLILNGTTVSSDRAQKARIRDAGALGAAVDALRVRRYARTDDPAGRERIGFVADELAAALPEAVVTVGPVLDGPPVPDGPPVDTGQRDDAGRPILHQPLRQPTKDGGQAVDLYAVVAALAGALQETRQQVVALAARVQALEARGGRP